MKYITCFIAFLFFVSPNALADIIMFEHRSNSVVLGRIGNQNFRARFVITAFGDTDDRESTGPGWIISHLSASIEIEGIGTFDFITSTETNVNNENETVGFTAGGPPIAFFAGPSHTDFADWDMTTSIGPIRSGGGRLGQWESPPVETTGGILEFEIWDNMDVTFTATVIPAPGVLALFGIAGFTSKRHRRRR